MYSVSRPSSGLENDSKGIIHSMYTQISRFQTHPTQLTVGTSYDVTMATKYWHTQSIGPLTPFDVHVLNERP